MFEKTCPLCSKILSLKQVSFSTAVYICDDLKCEYPVGFDCIIVERKFEDMEKDVETLNSRNEKLDDWIEDTEDKPLDKKVETSSSNIALVSEAPNDSDDPLIWIDNFIKKTDNENSDSLDVKVPEINQNNSQKVSNNVQTEMLDDLLDFFDNIN